MTESPLWRDTDVAEYLNVSRGTVWGYAGKGLPYLVLSPQVRRFDPAVVKAWVQSRQIGNVTQGRELAGEAATEREADLPLRENRVRSRGKGGRRDWQGASAKDAIT